MTDLLINTLECPGEFDALTTLRPGEPYFLLVGRDRLAPERVKDWAWANRERALAEFAEGKINEEKRDRELDKSTQAEKIAWAMVAYKNGHAAKAPRGEREATIRASEMPEDTRRRDALQSARVRAVSALNNAVAELTDLEPLLDRDEDEASDLTVTLTLIEGMKGAASLLAPRRPIGVAS